MAVILSVSCSEELRQLMRGKNISPSKALKVGALKLLGEPDLEEGVTIVENTEKNKIERIQQSMQQVINDLNEELEVLRK